jgi:hypothetical protein
MTFQRFRGWAGAVGGGRQRIRRSFGEARRFDGTPASDLVSGWLFDPPPAGLTTQTVGITSTASPSFKLAGVGGAGIGSAWTLAFGWSAASGSTRLIGGREGDGSEAIAVVVNANELQVYGFGASGSVGRYVTYAMGATQAFWVVRFRYPGTTVANGDIEAYKNGVLQTPVVNDNYTGCDANPRDFDLFVDAGGFTDNALAIYQFSLTAGWQDPADYFDGTDPYSFASMTPAPLIALGDGMTVAEWNNGTNLGSMGALTRTGTPDLVAGTPGTVDLAEAGGGGGTVLIAETGVFGLTGIAATLRAARKTVAETGVFALTGQAAGLRAGRRLVADSGAFGLGGNSASVKADRKTGAQTGAFSLIGYAAALKAARTVRADTGVFGLTGYDSFRVAGGAAETTLMAETGVFALTGYAAGLRANRRTVAASGVFVLAGQAATLRAGRKLRADTGAFGLSGQNAGLRADRRTAAATGVFVLSGGSASLRAARRLMASAGVFALTGYDTGSGVPIIISGSLVGSPRGGAVLNGRRRGQVLNAPQAGNVYGGRS